MLPRRFSSRRVSPRLMPDSLVNSPTAYVHRKTGTDPNSRLWNWCLSPFLHTAVNPAMPFTDFHRGAPHARLPRKSPATYVHRKTAVNPAMPPHRFSSRRASPRLMPDSLVNPPIAYVHRKTAVNPNNAAPPIFIPSSEPPPHARLSRKSPTAYVHRKTAVNRRHAVHRFSSRRVSPRPMP